MLGINERSRAIALTNNLRYEYQGYKLKDEKIVYFLDLRHGKLRY